ncbi:MAG: hypothetical protein U9Q81_03550 [Pseudomonadota bacterium]|nr:hypothetical protein [Pseudomonadota bacterium]
MTVLPRSGHLTGEDRDDLDGRRFFPATMGAVPLVLLQALALLLPALLVLYYASHAGSLPDYDYWLTVWQMLGDEGFSRDLSKWFKPENEHWVVITKGIYALNILLTGGHNVGLSVTAFLMALAQTLLLVFLARRTVGGGGLASVFPVLIVSAFLFTPQAVHNWFMGMSGVAWISANLFSLTAIFGLYRLAEGGCTGWLGVSLTAALIGCLTYSTPLAVWPALIVGGLLLRLRPWQQLAYLGAALAVYTIYLVSYDRPEFHPELQRSIGALLQYVLVFLGAVAADTKTGATVLGALGILASGFMAALFSLGDRPRFRAAIPWLMIQAYALANALMAAISRSGFGVEQALSSRYASLPALFWMSLFVLMLLTAKASRTERRGAFWLVGALIGFGGLAISMHLASYDQAQQYLVRAEKKKLAEAAWYTGADDRKLFIDTIAPSGVVVHLMNPVVKARLANIGHVPFDGRFDACPSLGEVVVPDRAIANQPRTQVPGAIEEIEERQESYVRIGGWLSTHRAPIACIALVNEDGVVRGFAASGLTRVVSVPKEDRDRLPWKGYALPNATDRSLAAALLMEENGPWVLLHDPVSLQ